MGDAGTPLGKAVRILNNQLQALGAIDERTDALEARLQALPLAAANGGAAA
jgi:nuclear pore complex protein Nup62